MEQIGGTLGNLRLGDNIPNLKISDPEPSLEEKREQLRKSLGVSSLDNTFEALNHWPGSEFAKQMFEDIAIEKGDLKMLLCYGGVGNGKTHLCEATAIELYKHGIFCRVYTMSRIMRALKECMGPEQSLSFEELLDRYCRCTHLIIDDVGMGGSGSKWEWGQLEDIIVARHHERLFTIMTTNLDISEIPPRIISRFMDKEIGSVVLNEGNDYRRQQT